MALLQAVYAFLRATIIMSLCRHLSGGLPHHVAKQKSILYCYESCSLESEVITHIYFFLYDA
jgi:hypothetical protein